MAQTGLGSGGLKGVKVATGGRLAAVLCVFSLVLFTASSREVGVGGPITFLRGAFSVATAPIRGIGSALTSPFSGVVNIYSNLTADQETLSDLKAQNQELRARNAALEESARNAERLESLLELRSSYDLQSTAARIISGSMDSWSSTVTIDKGSTAGIAVGMPVTDSTGAIGQVVECGPTTSVVRLMTDENSKISAMVQSSRATGTLCGSADGSLFLTMVSTDQKVSVGDTIITSGLGGVFPKGLPLGTVASVEKPEGALYYQIGVEPASLSEHHEEVLVVTSLTDDQRPTEEDLVPSEKEESGSDEAASQDAQTSGEEG